MASPFDDWTIEDVDEAIEEELAREYIYFLGGRVGQDTTMLLSTPTYLNPIDVNRAFVFGNHWQGGEGWIGPAPQPGESGYDTTMRTIQKGFTSRNAIGEVVQRHAAGVMGREPDWGMTPRRPMDVVEKPTKDEQSLIDEAEALLTEWWDKRKLHALLQRACGYVTWSMHGAVRLYIPEGLLPSANTPEGASQATRALTRLASAKDMASALDLIYVAIPLYNEGLLVTDEATQAQCGVVRYLFTPDEEANNEPIEVCELTYLDGDDTVIKTFTDEEGGPDEVVFRLPLGKRLTVNEMRRPLLITQQVQQMQRALNLAVSMLPRNVVTGGFLERVLLNAQMPGHWVASGDKSVPDKFVPDDYVTGAGTTNFVQGTQYTDPETGKLVLAAPQIHWRPPVEPKAAIEAAQEHYAEMLHECDQMHVLTVGDGKVGWQSREQARADYEASLRLTSSEADALGRWVLETALALGEAITGKVGYYTESLRASFTCRTDTGPVDAAERAQNDKSYQAGTMSQETAMQRNGIADPDAEMTRINAQPGGDLSILEKRAAIYATLASVGDAYGAAIIAGFTPAEAKALAGPVLDQTQTGAPAPNVAAPPGTTAAGPGAATQTGTEVALADNPKPGGGVGQAKPAPGTKQPKQPVRLQPDRIAKITV